MDNLNSILSEIGINLGNNSPVNTQVQEHTESHSLPSVQSISEEDENEILSSYGFREEVIQQEDTSSEESTNSSSLEDDAEEIIESFMTGYNASTDEIEEENEDEDEIAPVPDVELLQDNTLNTSTEEDNEEEDEDDYITSEEESVIHSLIPENSPTLLIDDSTSRFSGTSWYEEIQNKTIYIAGIGGIGSNLAFQISRLHPTMIYLYDDDMVDSSNMSGQLFSNSDIGLPKVNAISQMISRYNNSIGIRAINRRYTYNCVGNDIMMCGFDNMEARKTYYDSWKRHVICTLEEDRKKCLFIDGRLSIDTLQVFCITGDDEYHMKKYEELYLFSDEEADATVCSMKQTTFLACMIGSVMSNLFVNFVANLLDPIIPYYLPFMTEYDSIRMKYKTM